MKYFIYFVLACLSQIIVSQELPQYYKDMQARHAQAFGYNPEYRVNFNENIDIRGFLDTDIANFQFRDFSTGETFNLSPVSESIIGFSMKYKWFAIGFSFGPRFLMTSEDIELQKDSKSFKLELNLFYSDQWGQDLVYLFNRGFIVETNNDELIIEDFLALKDTRIQFIGGSTYYILNPNFSYRAFLNQTERQLKSAGSLVPKVTYLFSTTSPNMQIGDTEILVDKIKSFDIIADVGYYYTFVLKSKWYASLGAQPGLGYNFSNYKIQNSSSINFDSILFALKGEIALGYNSNRWFFGAVGNWRNYNNTNNENDQINRDSFYIKMHLGYRFNDNRPMREFFGWFEKTLGLDY